MPVIKYRKVVESLRRKPVFGTEELHHGGIKKGYSKKLLYTLSKTGDIKRIERGKYTFLDDPVAIATHITHPSYISLWTAMSIRHLTDQIPFAVEVITTRKRFKNTIDFRGTKIVFHKVPPAMMYGYENIIWKESTRIMVAKPEKIIIDAVYTKSIPESEILEAVENSDIILLKKYSELTGDIKIVEKINGLIEKCLRKRR